MTTYSIGNRITAQQFLLAVSAPDSIAVFLCLKFKCADLHI
nr:MAG TPA: hypothetical protein [Caudoviricetes sp.]DAQ03663.1 MAG TPA: hypothetical protein [Bacteriophage sp.]DAS28618.1 MAG TPA: hypothetical protein [Caudoviricetes sp.]DAU48983.1 MAG TPA: hypothetical protein [Caudoviricetes sp.]